MVMSGPMPAGSPGVITRRLFMSTPSSVQGITIPDSSPHTPGCAFLKPGFVLVFQFWAASLMLPPACVKAQPVLTCRNVLQPDAGYENRLRSGSGRQFHFFAC